MRGKGREGGDPRPGKSEGRVLERGAPVAAIDDRFNNGGRGIEKKKKQDRDQDEGNEDHARCEDIGERRHGKLSEASECGVVKAEEDVREEQHDEQETQDKRSI